MRSLAVIILALLIFPLAQAKNKKRTQDHIVVPTKIHCFKINTLLNELKTKYEEEPIFIGRSDLDKDAVTLMFVNQHTGSYTVVGAGKDIGCVLDTGDSVRYRMPKNLDNTLL